MRPAFSGHEQAIIFSIVGDSVEGILMLVAFFLQTSEIDPSHDLTRVRINNNNKIREPYIRVNFPIDIFQFIDLIDRSLPGMNSYLLQFGKKQQA